ncbi:MAG: acyl carrier protein [Pseudomonadota bacterium]
MLTIEKFKESVARAMMEAASVDSDMDLRDDDDFGDYGLDSLDGMNMLLELENMLGVDYGEIDLFEFNTVGKLYELTVTKLKS